MIIHSGDLLGTAAIRAEKVAETVAYALEEHPIDTVHILNMCIDDTVQVLAELVVARHGVTRRNPAFDDAESDHRIEQMKHQVKSIIGMLGMS